MAKKVGELNEGDIKKIRTESIGLLNDLDSISSSISDNLQKVSKLTGESVNAFKEGFSAAKSLGDAIAKVDSETLASRKQQSSFQDKVRKATEEATKLEAKASRLRQESVNFTKEQAREAYKVARAYEDGAEKLREQAAQAEKITNQFEKLNNQTRFFDGMSDLTKDVPIISGLFKDFQKASDKARAAASEGGSAFKAGAKELANLGVKGLGALGASFAVKGIVDIDERSTSIARNFNLTKQEGISLTKEFNKTAKTLANGAFSGKELQEYSVSFAQNLGSIGSISKDVTEELATQQKYLGLSSEEAGKFAKFTIATGINAKKLGNEIRGEVIASNALNKTSLDYKDILKNVANASSAIKLSTQGTGKSLGQAAIEAKKLGLSLSQVDKIADSLLNFESSISAEMEAELLTGQELNLEDARRLALNNDLAGVAQEITRQGITSEKFSKMNRIQQEAIAKSLGMSKDELADSLIEQQALTNMKVKDKKALEASVKKEYDKINLLKSQGKIKEAEVAREKLINNLGSDALVTQQENKSIAEMQALAAQRTVEAFDKLSPLLNIVQKVFGAIEKNANTIAVILGAMAGLQIFKMFKNLGKTFNGMASAAKSVAKFLGLGAKSSEKVVAATMKSTGKTVYGAAAKAAVKAGSATATKVAGKEGTKIAAKAGGKAFGKGLAKRIPILGSLVGIGFAIDRITKGDYVGAALEVGSAGLGLLDLVAPGVGTGLSLAADLAIAGRDMKKSGTITPGAPKKSPEKPMATGGIVTGPTRALVGEAGPEAVIPLTKFYEKMDELISVIKQGGNVYLDGTKVGTAMNVSTYRVQ